LGSVLFCTKQQKFGVLAMIGELYRKNVLLPNQFSGQKTNNAAEAILSSVPARNYAEFFIGKIGIRQKAEDARSNI
jgi:hypothetical protein